MEMSSISEGLAPAGITVAGGAVRIEGLSKHYGDFTAVHEVSFEVRQGEFLALLGPSGSGKTTILTMIAGFERPSGGRILVDGRSIEHLPPHKRDIGMVFQRYALFPHMTVTRNIDFPLRMRNLPAIEMRKRTEAALRTVGLDALGQRLPSQLSGGQQQRVALARAVVYQPPLLLMDEPLGALDKKMREKMQWEIKSLQRQIGATVIYVTHDQEEALTMADRIAVLDKGRLVQIGTPEELYEQPVDAFVANFIGETNFLNGHCIEADNDKYVVRLQDGQLAWCDRRLQAGNAIVPGDAITLSVRPEKIELTQSGPPAFALTGRVHDMVYAGSTRIYSVAINNQQRVLTRQPAGIERKAWRTGDQVFLAWDRLNARIFKRG